MKFIILFLILISSAYAYQPSCSKEGTKIIFSNGVDSSREQAYLHLLNLKSNENFLNSKIDKNYSIVDRPDHVEYVLRYNIRNQDDGLSAYIDFLRTTKLLLSTKIRQESGYTPDEETLITLVATVAVGIYTFPVNALLSAVNFVAQKVALFQVGQVLKDIESPNEINIEEMMKLYRKTLNDDFRIIALTHGDGNLYNNEAYNRLFDSRYGENVPNLDKKERFSSVHIAPLTEMLSENGVYRRFYGDRFYRNIILPFGSAIIFPEPNLCIPPNNDCGAAPIADSPTFHNFTITYLDFFPVGKPTLNDEYNGTIGGIIQAAEMLESNCSNCESPVNTCGGSPGRTYENSDGSCGGFVADTATVTSARLTIDANSEICGNSYISNNGIITNSSFTNTTITGIAELLPVNSTVTNSYLSVNSLTFSIIDSDVNGSTMNMGFDFGGVSIYRSQVSALVSGGLAGFAESEINAPVTGGYSMMSGQSLNIYNGSKINAALNAGVSMNIDHGIVNANVSAGTNINIENSLVNAPVTTGNYVSLVRSTINTPLTSSDWLWVIDNVVEAYP